LKAEKSWKGQKKRKEKKNAPHKSTGNCQVDNAPTIIYQTQFGFSSKIEFYFNSN
jgi:hypothetical protein